MPNVHPAMQLGTSITASPFYGAAREHAETEQDFGPSLVDFTAAMVAEHGPDANRLEVVSAYVHAWGMVRRSIPDPVRSNFRVIAPEVSREVTTAGYDWESVLDGLGNPTPGITYDYRDNLLPEPPANNLNNWWCRVLRRWSFKLGWFGAVGSGN
jgi:hypothetical protein